MTCDRCQAPLTEATAEHCWFDTDHRLCLRCFDEFGHCGHPEANELNRLAAAHDHQGIREYHRALRKSRT